ncbi:MAG TPA: ABC transporter permease [Alphaproteobacteria bacterium]|nr:ABC transporter permease [Alphaproteobacteria bacterium]
MARLNGDAATLPAREVAMPRLVSIVGNRAVRWASIVAFLAGWELLARTGLFTPYMLPAFSTVLERVWSDALSGDLPLNLGLTLYRALVGFAIAASGGIVLGVLIARVRVVRWFFDPLVSAGFPMPKIAFLPVFILWFGLYDVSKITMTVFDAIFPVITATVAGTQAVDRHLLWSARNMGASERELLWEIILPASLPQIMTGLQIALPIALIVEIVTEMLMGGAGLGGAMVTASRFADSPGVFAGLVEIAIAGFCLVKGMSMLRRRLLLWHQEALEPTTV